MPQTTTVPYKKLLGNLRSPDPDQQNYAFQSLRKATDSPVDWAYEVWDDLLRTLADGDNRQRSIAVQVLSNLAKSDSQQRMLKDLSALLKVTKDERFVTARCCTLTTGPNFLSPLTVAVLVLSANDLGQV